MNMRRSIKALLSLTAVLLLAIQAAAVRATVVMELTLEELVAQSALIFTGEVLAVDVSVEDELVYSTVTFALATTVKGQAPEPPTDWSPAANHDGTDHDGTPTPGNHDGTPTAASVEGTIIEGHPPATAGQILQLRFLGGQTAGLTVEVAGQQIPVAGDRGLFFISDPLSHQINPLTGWSQGWFPLLDAEDGRTYLDLRNHQDYALALGYPNPLAQKMQAVGFSRDQIQARVPGSLEFPLADFIAAITQIIELQGQ